MLCPMRHICCLGIYVVVLLLFVDLIKTGGTTVNLLMIMDDDRDGRPRGAATRDVVAILVPYETRGKSSAALRRRVNDDVRAHAS